MGIATGAKLPEAIQGVEDTEALALWTVIRPGYLVAVVLACWAVNLHIFGRFRVDYSAVLGLSKDELMGPQRLCFIALLIGVGLGLLHFFTLGPEPSLLVMMGVMFAYLIALLALFSWLPQPLARFRRGPFARAVCRCLCPDAGKEVPFIEVLVADGLTSVSRMLFDLVLGSCMVVGSSDVLWDSLVDGVPPLRQSRASGILDPKQLGTGVVRRQRLGNALEQCQQSPVPFIAWAGPFIIRARQCIVSSRNAPDNLSRVLHRVNLLKYLSALPMIIFALCYARAGNLQLILGKEDFEALWAVAAVFNSTFCFIWDLVMDWGLMQPAPWRSGQFGLRPVLLFRGIWGFYHFAILCNLLGRTLWSLRWSPQATLFLGNFLLASLQQAAEIIRRCLWNILRVEWECIRRSTPRTDKHFPV